MARIVDADVVVDAKVKVVVVNSVVAMEEDVAEEDIYAISTLMPCPDPTVCSVPKHIATPLTNGND